MNFAIKMFDIIDNENNATVIYIRVYMMAAYYCLRAACLYSSEISSFNN